MKVTKRQLRRIIKEEKAKLVEGKSGQREAELIDEIVDLLIEAGAIRMPGTVAGDNSEPDYAEAIQYLKNAVIPTLESYIQPKFIDMTDPRRG